MTLDEAIENLENPNVHEMTPSNLELTKWLKGLRELAKLQPQMLADLHQHLISAEKENAELKAYTGVIKHIKQRMYETALNSTGNWDDAGKTIEDIADRLDAWVEEYQGGK